MKQVFDAAMRVHRSQERIRELRESLEPCEPVKAWRDADEAMTIEERMAGTARPAEPQFCAKRAPLHDTEPHFSFAADGSDYWEAMRYLTPDEVPAFIAEHWCAACQRNSPKVVEIRALKRALGSHRGTLTKACRKAEKAHMSPDEPKRARTTQSEVDCEADVDNRARARQGVCERR